MARKPGKKHAETIEMIEQGASNNEISKALSVPLPTVKSRRKAWKKLKAGNEDCNPVAVKALQTGPSYTEKNNSDGLQSSDKVPGSHRVPQATEAYGEVLSPDDDPDGASAQTIPEDNNVVAFVKPSQKEREGKKIKAPDTVQPDGIQHITQLLQAAKQVPLPSIEKLKQVNWDRAVNARDADTQYRYMTLYIRLIQTEATLPETQTDPWKDWTTDDRDAAMARIIEKFCTDEELAQIG